jgi:phospholipid transport system substrate-binding protein
MSKPYKYMFLVGLFLTLQLISPARAAVPPESDPLTQIRQGVSDVMAVFHVPDMPLAERREKLRILADRYFDFDDMARSVLGYHWRALTPAQRAQFVPVFTLFIQDAYLSKLQDYTVRKVQDEAKTAKIEFTGEKFEGADYAEVSSTVGLRDQQDPLAVNYEMHRNNGLWRIYDVSVDGISVIANYRNQFDRVINNDGYDALVTQLKSKEEQLQEYLERPPQPENSQAKSESN